MKKTALLVGGSGFVGVHLAQRLGAQFAVVSTGRKVDVRDRAALRELVERARPDVVVHLAAVSSLRESFDDPQATYDINFSGVLNLLMALRDASFAGRMLYVSSSEVYGRIGERDLPVCETTALRPLSPYAVSKIAAEALCFQWSRTADFEIVIARPFNHIGPGQSERFAMGDFGRQLALIKLGLQPPVIEVGDIDTTRDFTDVRDIVAAYEQLLVAGANGEIYNVCAGSERSIRALLARMCELAGVAVDIRTDAARLRASEQRRVRGDNRKLAQATGWSPVVPIGQTLGDIVDYWLEVVRRETC